MKQPMVGGYIFRLDKLVATADAMNLVSKNGLNSNIASINYNIDTVNNPSGAEEINVTLAQRVPTYFIKLAGISTVNVSVLAEGISVAGGPFGYSLFNGGSSTLTLNSATYKGQCIVVAM